MGVMSSRLRRHAAPRAIGRSLLAVPWMMAWLVVATLALREEPVTGLLIVLACLGAFIGWNVVRPVRGRSRLAAWLRLRPAGLYVEWLVLATAGKLLLLAGTVILYSVVASWSLLPALPSIPPRVSPAFVAHPAGVLAYGLLMAAFVPLVEEFGFRGWMQHELEHGVGLTTAILVPALTFSAMHGVLNGMHHLPYALFAGWVVWRTGSIWPAVFMHALNNTLVTLPFVSRADATSDSLDYLSPYWPYALIVAALGLAAFAVAARQIDRKARLDRPHHHPRSWWNSPRASASFASGG
jgi:membrane protease YdiL (CAAX protease family)